MSIIYISYYIIFMLKSSFIWIYLGVHITGKQILSLRKSFKGDLGFLHRSLNS